ncbi:hypothetical protein KY284_020164 [Solanum tuberosum]|nr:hypothetical protein KY284_020164 [Solanum tuberosum]
MTNGMAAKGTSTGNGNGVTSPVTFPVIDHNHPLFLQHTDTLVRPGLLSSVVYASDAHKVWLDLRERLRDIWDEYDSLMPCPSCPCPESKKFGEHCDY